MVGRHIGSLSVSESSRCKVGSSIRIYINITIIIDRIKSQLKTAQEAKRFSGNNSIHFVFLLLKQQNKKNEHSNTARLPIPIKSNESEQKKSRHRSIETRNITISVCFHFILVVRRIHQKMFDYALSGYFELFFSSSSSDSVVVCLSDSNDIN